MGEGGRAVPPVRAQALEVCRADASQWQVHRSVRLAMLLDTPLAYGSTFAREVALTGAQWRARMRDSTSWLAREGDQPVGSVTLYRFPEQAADEGCLVAMWVAAHARGRGVADALVEALLDHAREMGLRRVTLDVADDNPRARGFYRRMGFVPTGRTGALPHHPELTEHELERVIG
jgi:RimJ/RimL family protein N-acetyltransferase